MYALLPILAFLATANAAPVAVNNNVEVVDKRACLDPLGILCFGGGAAAPSSSSSSAKASSTSSSASSTSSSASASKSSSSSVAPTSTTPASSSSSASASKSAAASSSSSAGNVVQSVVAVPSQVVSAVIKCPLDPLGVLGLCVDANTGASSSAAVSASKSSASAQATTTSAPASSASASASGNIVQSVVAVPSQVVSAVIKCPLDPLGVLGLCVDANTGASSSASVSKASASASSSSAAGAGNVISSIVAVPSAVVSTVQSVANPVVSSAASVIAPVASAASSVVAPVASAASSVVAPVASAASSVVAPVASAANSVVAPVASAASSVVAPVASAASSVVAPVASAASSVVAPVASAASSVVAPIVSVIVPSPAASSVSSIIASVSASSAAPPSSSSAVVVTPTSTASSSSAAPSASAAPGNANVANWAYTACVQEGTNGRALTGSMFGGSGMTVESCLASCDASGFLYAGLEYGQECWCGSSLANGASLAKTGTCDMPCAGNGKELCGGSSTLSLYTSTKAQSQAPALPAGWSSTTCMQEVSGRAFTKSSFASDDMTVNKCISFCGNSKYAAVEYGRECYCGDDVSNGASLTSTSGQCNVPCAGLASQTCGGPNALQVYTNAGYKTASSGAYTNTGCWQEVDGRLLRGASIASDSMTIDTCTSFCQSQGFKIAGLEYGKECYCDNSPVSSPLTSGQCNMACAGNAGQNCGGPNALNVFQLGA